MSEITLVTYKYYGDKMKQTENTLPTPSTRSVLLPIRTEWNIIRPFKISFKKTFMK